MNAVSDTAERVALYYREGSSDKVYQAAIEPAGNQFVVNFAYGRRGATLTTGTKTSSPVDYAAAKKIFMKLVSEKKAKGYTEGASGTPYQHADKQASGVLPQLLNPVEEAEVELLLRDDNYCAQEKFDGRHLLVRKQDDDLEGINKKGFVVGLPQTVANELRGVSGSFIPDGEAIGDDYHAFDLLEYNGENLRLLPYRIRLARLIDLLLLTPSDYQHIRLVETAFSTQQKTELCWPSNSALNVNSCCHWPAANLTRSSALLAPWPSCSPASLACFRYCSSRCKIHGRRTLSIR